MTIYNIPRRNNINYRKIYEDKFGPIPKDELGRSFHIHHIDGDPGNNSIENLMCLSIQDHYDLHLSQGDYAAARLLAIQLKKDPKEISELSKKIINANNKRMIQSGTHPWLGPTHNQIKNAREISNGTHPWLGPENNRKRIKNGTHPFVNSEIQSSIAKNSVKNGTNALVGGKVQKLTQQRLLEEGKHFSQIKMSCVYCGKTISMPNHKRWHGDNCKKK